MKQRRCFFLLSGIYYCSFCSLFAYLVSIFLEYGYTEIECGWLTTILFAVFLVVDPFYGYIIDKFLSPKKLFVGLIVVSIVLTRVMPLAFSMGFGVTVIMVILISIFDLSANHVIEVWINTAVKQDATMDYGVIRSAGSVFYAFTALLCGYLISKLGIDVLFVVHFGFLVLTLIVAMFVKDKTTKEKTYKRRQKETGLLAFTCVLSNKAFVVFLISGCLFYIATRSVQTYMQLVVDDVGGEMGSYSNSMFFYCIGEFFVVQFASKMLDKGVKIEKLFSISLATMAARILLLVIINDMQQLLITQIIMSIGMGCYIRFAIEYIAELFPKKHTGFAILTGTAITQGVGSIFGNLIGGYLISEVGLNNYLIICVILLVFALLIYTIGTKLQLKNRKEEIK